MPGVLNAVMNEVEGKEVAGEILMGEEAVVSGFSWKCNSPNISVKEGSSSMDEDLDFIVWIGFHEERELSIGWFSGGNGLSNMC